MQDKQFQSLRFHLYRIQSVINSHKNTGYAELLFPPFKNRLERQILSVRSKEHNIHTLSYYE